MSDFNNKGNKKANTEDTINWEEAAIKASSCEYFKEDDEDECIADEAVSCCNCRYRRWTDKSFICLKQA